MNSVVAKEAPPEFDLAESVDGDLPRQAGGSSPSWVFFAKAAISATLILALCLSVGSREILDTLIHAAPLPFLAAILAFSVQCGLAALRCRAVVNPSRRLSFAEHLRFFWIGQFFNQLLPSTIGGDAVRSWLLSRRGLLLQTAIKLTLVDRIAGVIALMLMMILLASLPSTSLPLIGGASQKLGLIAAAGLCAFVLSLVVIQQKAVARLLVGLRLIMPLIALLEELASLFRSPSRAAQIFVLAFLVHGCSIIAFWLAARSIGEPLGLLESAVIVPPMLLISMMPISVAGWGVREGVVLIGLQLQGVSAEASISVALLFGLALLIASLPGSFLWLTRRPERWRR